MIIDRLMPLLEAHTTERILRDADAYLGFLGTRPEVRPGPVATVGYCIGGALAMRTATAHPGRVAAVAGFHPGFLVTDAPDSPHRRIPELTAEVHLGLSGHDMSSRGPRRTRTGLGRRWCPLHRRDLSRHRARFTMSDTDAFSPLGLRRHWDRLLALLDRTLGEN
ncbi:hypothetical protein GCM10017687_05410 [Streptomyces echinatus]